MKGKRERMRVKGGGGVCLCLEGSGSPTGSGESRCCSGRGRFGGWKGGRRRGCHPRSALEPNLPPPLKAPSLPAQAQPGPAPRDGARPGGGGRKEGGP